MACSIVAALGLAAMSIGGCEAQQDAGTPPAPPADPPAAVEIRGQVVSYPDGVPIPDISVVVFDVQANYEVFTTDEDGYYEATDLEPDFYRIKAWPLDGQNWIGAYYSDMYFYCSGTLLDLRVDALADGVDFRLPAGGTVEGTITDALDGAPIESARVDVRGLDYYNSNLDPTTYTDAEGRYQVVGLDSAIESVDSPTPVPGNYELKVTVSGRPVVYHPDGYADDDAVPVEAIRDQVSAGVDLVIPAGASITGNVSDAEGQPLDSGTVYARNDAEPWIQVTAAIGTGGDFEAGGLAPGTYTLEVSSSGYAAIELGEPVEVAEDEAVGGVDAALDAEGVITGSVHGLAEPLHDVTAHAYPVDGGPDPSESSAEDGSFAVGSLTAASYNLHLRTNDERFLSGYVCGGTVCADSAEADAIGAEPGETTAIGTVALPAAAAIEGRVVERETERPLSRIYVTAIPEQDGESTTLAITDDDGSFTLAPLVPGSYTLQAEPYRYCPGDPGWVTTYSGGARAMQDALVIQVGGGATYTTDLALPSDVDGDGMADLWEWLHFLDPAVDDALDDPDLDGVANIDEYLEGTDPREDLLVSGCSVAAKGRAPLGTALAFVVLWRRYRRRGDRQP